MSYEIVDAEPIARTYGGRTKANNPFLEHVRALIGATSADGKPKAKAVTVPTEESDKIRRQIGDAGSQLGVTAHRVPAHNHDAGTTTITFWTVARRARKTKNEN